MLKRPKEYGERYRETNSKKLCLSHIVFSFTLIPRNEISGNPSAYKYRK